MTLKTYTDFLTNKRTQDVATGLATIPNLNPMLFPFQQDIVRWALKRGRAAVFADCGLGKSPIQLEWARHVGGRVLVLAPLAVSTQLVREAFKFGIGAHYCHDQSEVTNGINITNYERLEKFDSSDFKGIVLDESSILKAYDGKTRTKIIDSFQDTPFRLACTATPAPNDYMELGNHAEFLGVMQRMEMLAMFFVHDMGQTQKWRLKGHAEDEFWRWVCDWSVMLRAPSDLGYANDGFVLPDLNIHNAAVGAEYVKDGYLFPMQAVTLQDRLAARRHSIPERTTRLAEIVNQHNSEAWLVWCNLNAESAAAVQAIPDAVEVKGSDSAELKEESMLKFSSGDIRVLVTKPKIAGFGMNWQHCAHVAFVGLSDSWESWYQAVRRCWRFGQKRDVNVYVITADTEGRVVANIKRKERQASSMFENMLAHTRSINTANIHATERTMAEYTTDHKRGEGWNLYLGDCVDVLRSAVTDESIHYSIFSPPFASLYTYSNSERDMGNSKNHAVFFEHFRYLISELHRVLMSGRLVSVHCMNLPTVKIRDGFIGITDFRGEVIRVFQNAGFVYHSEVCIWKDPVTAMQRTKALGLLYKQLKKDSAMSRQGIPDYVCTFRKRGENAEPVSHTPTDFPLPLWQNYASPIWNDIIPSDTLQHRSAREHKDEKHIAPLQLEVIRRCLKMWSNPDDLVLSPFTGIGSEGYVSLEEGRRFVGIELKRSYYEQAHKNLQQAEPHDLFTQAVGD
jgi:superfamily II DNA or RNA helicase